MNKELQEVLESLESLGSEKYRQGLQRFGVPNTQAFGVKMPDLRQLGKTIGKNQALAEMLWKEGHHESKILASLVGEFSKMTLAKADDWVADLYSWDTCDQLCSNLLGYTHFAWDLPHRWAPSEEEFTRRAGLVMIVALRLKNKKAPAHAFEKFYPLLREHALDSRNFVKKAVNWAIRDLGKTSVYRHPQMVELCNELKETDSASAKWIAADALRELEGEAVLRRLDV